MRPLIVIIAVLALAPSLRAAAAPATAPPALDATLCPPAWKSSLLYYQSFDTPDSKPEVCAGDLKVLATLTPQPGGFHRRCGGAPPETSGTPAAARKPGVVSLESASLLLSPHQPLTISLWWALPEDLPDAGGFGLVYLQGGRGYIGHFIHGGDGWCELKQPAGVVQVYYLPGISNVNGVYDLKVRDTLGLKRGQWHHSAVVCSGASLVSAYTDGRLVFETRTTGRSFAAADAFKALRLGGGVWLDEIAILRRPLNAEEIAEYVTALRGRREAYGE